MHTTNIVNPAALPWYSFPATRPVLDSIWNDVALELLTAGIEHLPESLDHTTQYRVLLEKSSLILSQCCSPDLFEDYATNVVPFAAPVISAYQVEPGYYYSHIVTGKSAKLNNPRVVINNRTSHSGCTAAKLWLAAQGIENYSIHESGSHYNSVHELKARRADIAAIDALSWCFLDTAGLQILGNSDPVLAPPFITGLNSNVPTDLMRQALDGAFKRYGKDLGITGLVPLTKDDYHYAGDRTIDRTSPGT